MLWVDDFLALANESAYYMLLTIRITALYHKRLLLVKVASRQ